jgi:hypothetical protein
VALTNIKLHRGENAEPIKAQMQCNCEVADTNAAMSWRGGAPNIRRYSRRNWDGLSFGRAAIIVLPM